MIKYKRALCALLVTASVAGTSQIIIAATNQENKITKVSENKSILSDEVIIPKRTFLVKAESNEFESIIPEKILNAKDVLAFKEKEAKLAAIAKEKKRIEEAEKARLVAEAEKAKKAAEEKKAKIAAEKAAKAKKVVTTAAKSTTKVIASRSTTSTTVSTEKAQEIIEYAKQFMGIKYVFGGASPKGFDCSGFTMYVFNKFGISLPHSASGQSELGAAVSKSDLIPGDLVFFETYKAGISHVGIYIGSGNFLEASSSRGIAITKLSSSYYKSRYMGATRILK
ncbi:MAG: NlpC/P60 family protein [Clostridiales bacterium]|jgi:cell wall-associated NlpC family hydrolase|nr:NlpC/P60 family protein [Clostridiales bacterium]